MLSIYAIKCGRNVSEEELIKDAYSFLDKFDAMSIEETNRFTEKDVMDALQAYYDKDLVTYPIGSIAYNSGIPIKQNKRNGRKRAEHIRLMNFVRDELNQNKTWNKEGNGRKPKKDIVQQWRLENPDGRKIDCERETGLSRHTVLKWW
ncbi:Uncharacterised protein [Chlamydia trachomatis]|nr:Uncharacterised protein [Chlamydia trachomatis]